MNGELLKEIEEKLEILAKNRDVYQANITRLRGKNDRGISLSKEETMRLYSDDRKLRDNILASEDYEKIYTYLNGQDHLTSLYNAKKNEEDLKKSLVNKIINDFELYHSDLEDERNNGEISNEYFVDKYVNIDKLNSDLNDLKSNFVKETLRKEIYEKYFNKYQVRINDIYKLGRIYKDGLFETAESINVSNKKYNIALIAGSVISLAALLFALRSCDNEATRIIPDETLDTEPTTEFSTTVAPTTANETTTSKTGEETTINSTISEPTTTVAPTTVETTLSENDKLVNALVKNGYPKELATNIVDKYNGYVVAELMTIKYNDGINADYILDYIEIKNRFGISFSESVDYVNRAYKINATGFYEELGFDLVDIVAVVKTIDTKDLNSEESGALFQSIHTTLNHIVDNYIFGETTTKDIEKLEALKYFAKDNSDMDKFLEKYADLTQKVLKESDNNENNKILEDFLYINSVSLNGFINIDNEEPEKVINIVKTYGEEFAKEAEVVDLHDWVILEQDFIQPMFNLVYDKKAFGLDQIIDSKDQYTLKQKFVELNLVYDKENIAIDFFPIEGFYYSFNTKEARKQALKELRLDEKTEKLILNIFDVFNIRDLYTTAELSPEITALCGHGGYIRGLQNENNGGE